MIKKNLLQPILAVILSIVLTACTSKADTPVKPPVSDKENTVISEKLKNNDNTKPDNPGNEVSEPNNGTSNPNTQDSGKEDNNIATPGPGKENNTADTPDTENENNDPDTSDPGKNGISQEEIDRKLADWKPDLTFSTSDFDLFNWDDTCFAYAKLTMINLWAYWCGPCRSELPEINRLSDEYADKGVQIFGLTYPEEESLNREVVDEFGLTYQMLLYTEDFDSYMDSGFLPTTIFVDTNGHVIGEPVIGARSYEEWKAMIDEYLK